MLRLAGSCSGQPAEIFRELPYSFFFRSPGGHEADGRVVFIDLLLVLELIGFAQLSDQIIGQNGELLVCGRLGEEGGTAFFKGLL